MTTNTITLDTPLSEIVLGNGQAVFQIEVKCFALGVQVKCLGDLVECVKAFGVERQFLRRGMDCCFYLSVPDPIDAREDILGHPARFTYFHSLGGKNAGRIRDAFDAVGFDWRSYIGPQRKQVAKDNQLVSAIHDLTNAINRLIATIEAVQ